MVETSVALEVTNSMYKDYDNNENIDDTYDKMNFGKVLLQNLGCLCSVPCADYPLDRHEAGKQYKLRKI